jgi:hypothetical protein
MNSRFTTTFDVIGVEWNLIAAFPPFYQVVLLFADVRDTFALKPQSMQMLEETAIDPAITGATGFSDIINLGEIQNVLVDVSLHIGQLTHDDLFILRGQELFENVFFFSLDHNSTQLLLQRTRFGIADTDQVWSSRLCPFQGKPCQNEDTNISR